MNAIIHNIEQQQLETLTEGKNIPDFKAGDTIRVNVRIVEGSTERIQAFEGVCIARKNNGIGSSFIVRKISNGEGVERTFPLYSPKVDSIQLIRRGVVRRAKLYYLRERSGKSARIREKLDFANNKSEKNGKAKPAKEKASKAEAAPAAEEKTEAKSKPAAKKETAQKAAPKKPTAKAEKKPTEDKK